MPPGLLSRWLLFGEWRAQPLRALLAIAAIAVGVAMGFAIHLINAAAFNEFSTAIAGPSGTSRRPGEPGARRCSTKRSIRAWPSVTASRSLRRCSNSTPGVRRASAALKSSASTLRAAPSRPTCSA
jgi:putative ABC transport system permease protein